MSHTPSKTMINLTNVLVAFSAATAQFKTQKNVFPRLLEPRIRLIFGNTKTYASTVHLYHSSPGQLPMSLRYLFSFFLVVLITILLPQHALSADVSISKKRRARKTFPDTQLLIIYSPTSVSTQTLHTISKF